MTKHSFQGPVDQVFTAVEIHNHYHVSPPLALMDARAECAGCRRVKLLGYALVVLVGFVLLVVLAFEAKATPAAPTYDKARIFTNSLMVVVDESFLVMVDTSKKLKRAREVNALEALAVATFGKQDVGDRFFVCVTAAVWAREYWHGQREILDSTGVVTPHAVNGAARAGFRFGDYYRQCKNEVETLDPIQPRGPLQIIDAPKPPPR